MKLGTRLIMIQKAANIEAVFQEANPQREGFQHVHGQDDPSTPPQGGSTPSGKEARDHPQRRHRRSSMGADLLTGHARRHRRSSLGPSRMEYAGAEPTGLR